MYILKVGTRTLSYILYKKMYSVEYHFFHATVGYSFHNTDSVIMAAYPTTLMDTGLISSLITYFNVNILVTCLSDHDEVRDFGWRKEFLQWPVSHLIVEADDLASIGNFQRALIICQSDKLAQVSLKREAFDNSMIWLFDSSDYVKIDVLAILPLTLSSNVLVATELPDGGLELHEHYSVKSRRKRARFGKWGSKKGLKVMRDKFERRANFTGVEITTTIKTFNSLVILKSDHEFSGWFGEVISYIQQELDFR